jgi:hypothetical protein
MPAALKAPQRKGPCRSRALSVDPSCSSFRCAQPILRGGSITHEIKTITIAPAPEASAPAPVVQGKQGDGGRFRLQVDRQTKASYATYEAAEAAGKAIKKDYPILQVAVYDGVESVNKIIELP